MAVMPGVPPDRAVVTTLTCHSKPYSRKSSARGWTNVRALVDKPWHAQSPSSVSPADPPGAAPLARENFPSEALQMLARCIEKPITTASTMD